MSAGEYRFLEHMTDAEVEAFGPTLAVAFQNAGKALEDTMVDIGAITPRVRDHIRVEGRDEEDLLYEWLESLIVKQDTEGMLYSSFECDISGGAEGMMKLEATAFGERFDPAKHEQKTAVKAPTFHGMKIERDPEKRRVTLRFLLDL